MSQDNDRVIFFSQLVLGMLSSKKNISFDELISLSNYLLEKYPELVIYEPDDDYKKISQYAIIDKDSIVLKQEYENNNIIKCFFEDYAGKEVVQYLDEKSSYSLNKSLYKQKKIHKVLSIFR